MKHFLSAAAMLVSVIWSASGQYTAGYYDDMDGLKKEQLKQAAKKCVAPHTRLDYYGLPAVWEETDVYPERVNGQLRWWEMYSNNIYLIRSGQTAFQSFSANRMNREHSIPKSWWKVNNDVEYTDAYTDLWNLYPSDSQANTAKSNYPFAPVRSASFDNGLSKVGPPVSGYGGSAPMAFEPGDEYKGDFARSIFYMATVYDSLPWKYGWMFMNGSAWPTLREWAYNMLLQWARQDPVSQKEINRNNAVELAQGNRNPFIDFPELAEYIWGLRTNETFYLADQGSTLPPPITGNPELTKPVNNTTLDLAQAAIGYTVSSALEIAGTNLTSPLTVSIIGPDKDMFSTDIRSIPPSAVNTGATYLLHVYFTPASTGSHWAWLSLYDGGLPDDKSVRVKLLGEGCEVPQLNRLTALPATELTSTSYRANWGAAPEVVDYYVVNRTRYTAEGTESEALQADTNSLLIEDRNENTGESYTVSSVRLGLISEPSNEIIVEAGAGLRETESGDVRFVSDEEGLTVITGMINVPYAVYDVHGRLLVSGEACNGTRIILPGAGLYIVIAREAKPVKIVI